MEKQKKQKILVRFGEIFLKSPFVFRQMRRRLVENIRRELKKRMIVAKIWLGEGRVILETVAKEEKNVSDILKHSFGVASFSIVHECNPETGEIKNTAKKIAAKWKKGDSFAVRTRRADKSFGYSSQQVNEITGSLISSLGYKVNLSAPDNVLYIEIGKTVFLFDNKIPGPGGLPLAKSCVFSSLRTKEDLLATWLVMKRGLKPVLDSSSKKKLVKILEKWAVGHCFSFVDKAIAKLSKNKTKNKIKALIVSNSDIKKTDKLRKSFLVLTPLAGMRAKEIKEKIKYLYR